MHSAIGRVVVSTALGAVVLGACSSNSPSDTPVATHPSGHAVYSTAVDNGPWGVAISSQGLAYMTRPLTDSVAIINLSGPSVISSFQVGNRPDDMAFNSSGTTAYVTNLDDGTVGVINTATGAQTTTYPVASQPLRIVVGAALYVTMTDGNLAVLNAGTGALIKTIAIGGTPNGLALDASAGRLYVGSTAGTVTVISTTTNAPVDTLQVGGIPRMWQFSPAGTPFTWPTRRGGSTFETCRPEPEPIRSLSLRRSAWGSRLTGRRSGSRNPAWAEWRSSTLRALRLSTRP